MKNKIAPFKNNIGITDFILLCVFVLYMAGASPIIHSNVFSICVLTFLLIVFVNRKKKFDIVILILFFIWLIINIVSFFVNSPSSFPFEEFSLSFMRLIIAYLIFKNVGITFFNKLFDFTYVLVLFSLPLFVLEQTLPSVFSSIAPIFRFMTNPEQAQFNGFYSFIFMHSSWAGFRNCGFMWEPGGYACILIFLLNYHFFINHYHIDQKAFIIILALISTFSTAGYLALFFTLISFVFENPVLKMKGKLFSILLISILLFSGIIFFQKADFMQSKISAVMDMGTNTWEKDYGDYIYIRVSRLGIAQISLDNAFHHPFGDGVIYSRYIQDKYGVVGGPSFLSEVLRQWGWLGLIAIILVSYFFARRYVKSAFISILFVISMCIVWFSNPSAVRYIPFVIFYYVITVKSYLPLYNRRIIKGDISIVRSNS